MSPVLTCVCYGDVLGVGCLLCSHIHAIVYTGRRSAVEFCCSAGLYSVGLQAFLKALEDLGALCGANYRSSSWLSGCIASVHGDVDPTHAILSPLPFLSLGIVVQI